MPNRPESAPSPPRLLVRGNTKLGQGIWSFSMPAGDTCPGQTPACSRHCYAKAGRYAFGSVRQRLARNLELSRRPEFVGLMLSELRRVCAAVVRIHAAGDFYCAEYARQWVRIAAACPGTRFFAYTRSWRVPEIRMELVRMARLPNVRLWLSCDRDTGLLPGSLKGLRLAWMQTAADDLPPRADLVFRIRPLRKVVSKRIGLAIVCPVENGVTSTDCARCRICWEADRR